MKLKLVGGLVLGLVIMFSFQNCAQAPRADDISGQTSAFAAKVDLQGEKLNQIDFLIQENESVSRAGRTYSLAVNKNLQVNLITGVMSVVSDLGGPATEFCLTEGLRNELISVLKASQICKKPEAPAGKLCTMVMKLPYAQIRTDVDQFDLGAANDGCGSGGVDLCGAQADMLKGYAAALKARYKSLSCP